MDSLDNTSWDVVVTGTGLPQSLLVLSLSRSGKQILHIDRNDYYGGDEAVLSLSEAEQWVKNHGGDASERADSTYSHATISHLDAQEGGAKKLGFARAYSLALAPHLVYARSNLLPAVVSSRTHSQLEFQAVGSWFTITAPPDGSPPRSRLTRVPSGREDVFRDDSLDLRAKRSLMKFLRFVASYDEENEQQRMEQLKSLPLSVALKQHFGMNSTTAVAPLLALALPTVSEIETTMEFAVPKIARHLRSIGIFGPGFSAVLPKWGGLAEIAQVACRACAVGGGVYVLGKGVMNATRAEDAEDAEDSKLRLELTGGEKVTAQWLVGCPPDLPHTISTPIPSQASSAEYMAKNISIVSSPLTSLFPPTAEGGVIPAGAVIWVEVAGSSSPSVRILVHSSESGECPAGQCVLYASLRGDPSILDTAVQHLLESVGEQPTPKVLWRMQYRHYTETEQPRGTTTSEGVVMLQSLSTDIVLEDDVLTDVEEAWRKIMGERAEGFMKFESREGVEEDE
ncbi:Rab proteins geranylgeranyltransferase component A [Friedmanniomyces endolithicus]|uniref:Rab proteins geranylgeranyltransferase n=1 Tax=Friedmanniomyces endolithicus TaxID=329885 RepID=A0A4U0UYN5_9PEZI|nr:Rab proteins geranylgeranyltransferase component A [Friedmanniomyces endolithicus]KAK0272124.1 Rab proteins geranylgeranyltransferase component A [Friedmanniomyces endolithicus]KAK0283085.1 Rab proteins geranylgeranyltransferase component A [Friedmanniomyces endolithicus]KAK0314507.1 Rab proteins geranylgeranyltransferase component A [Friedmanniomyces endolithicus]KAK0326035.1 Rab proteins geranylgeranyltransferase component A [Friedmanniomyces endolithicus]